MLLENKIALITGASSGIGKATASLFAKEGARLALLGRDAKALQAMAAATSAPEQRALSLPADVTRAEDCRRAVQEAAAHFGGLDILVNAAGIIGNGTIQNTTPEAWAQMMDVNLNAAFYMMQFAVPYLGKSRGNIVNVSSVTGLRAFPNVLAYCVSKAGLDQLTRCAALELAPAGVRVNAVNPGVVVTNLHRRSGMDEAKYAAFLEHSKTTHPLGRVGQPEDVAEAVLYLASGRAGWITGVTLSVDGGRQLTCAR
jgi:NAD(P)-dependent dehydrogenase (short-subunit alcohol dehydrogenase family)